MQIHKNHDVGYLDHLYSLNSGWNILYTQWNKCCLQTVPLVDQPKSKMEKKKDFYCNMQINKTMKYELNQN